MKTVCSILLFLFMAGILSAATAGAPPTCEVTYVANEGFLFEAAGKKILIDAVFEKKNLTYAAPTPELLEQMTLGRAPFDKVDLLLISHRHGDHFTPNRVAAFMRNNPTTILIAHRQVVDDLRPVEGFSSFENRIREIDLEIGSSAHLDIDGILIDLVCLYHAGGTKGETKNLAFAVKLGGFSFFHLGDSALNQNVQELNAFPFENLPTDVLFVEHFDRSVKSQATIRERIKPGHIVAMHTPPAQFAETAESFRSVFPSALLFEQSMESHHFAARSDTTKSVGAFLGQTPPDGTPQVFARGTVSTDHLEHSAPTFPPDGNEVFWSLWRRPKVEGEPQVIMTMRREGGAWSAPAVVPFSGEFVDGGPVFSADGKRLYFYSSRPTPGEIKGDDLWFVERRDSGWSEPKCLGLVARFPEIKRAGQPSIARNGTLYFMAHAPGPLNDSGIYRAELVHGEYAKPQLLPPSINAPGLLNWTPFIAPDESYLLFSSNRRNSARDYGDLYITRRQADGSWSDPVSLGEPVNSGRQERFPMLSPDGLYLFFTRPTPGHDQDVYWVGTATILALRFQPKNLPEIK